MAPVPTRVYPYLPSFTSISKGSHPVLSLGFPLSVLFNLTGCLACAYNTDSCRLALADINDINTVQDLISIQKMRPMSTKEVVRDLSKPIFEETPAIGMEVLDNILCGIIDLHETMIDSLQEKKGNEESINAWTMDLAKLHIAQELLDSIRL
jgi:hypothetical protein